MNCEQARSILHSYVDAELVASEAMALEAHILDCRACAEEYANLRDVVDAVRSSKPLYQAPAEGRSKLEGTIALHYRRRRVSRWFTVAAACALLIAAAVWVQRVRRAAPFEHFVAFAADTHHRYGRGALALDVRSDDGPAVSAWLGERLPFQTSLPKYPAQPATWRRYTLVGARVLPFEDHSFGYVAFEIEGRPISLLIAPASVVTPAGGQVYRSGALDFHFLSRDGLQLIAWIDRGISYALVSEVQVSGARSCVVCHGSEAERPKFEGLGPAPSKQ